MIAAETGSGMGASVETSRPDFAEPTDKLDQSGKVLQESSAPIIKKKKESSAPILLSPALHIPRSSPRPAELKGTPWIIHPYYAAARVPPPMAALVALSSNSSSATILASRARTLLPSPTPLSPASLPGKLNLANERKERTNLLINQQKKPFHKP